MASGALPEPGTEYGPCLDKGCGHVDCDATRATAALVCPECGKSIGYDRRFCALQIKDGRIIKAEHWVCAHLAAHAP